MHYHQRALQAFAYLFRPYNDIDVYVEDGSIINVYEILINRILKPEAKVTRVFALGSRDQVISACRADTEASERPRIYVIDGDLDLLTGAPTPNVPRLHRLAVYSVENLLFCGRACVELAVESRPATSREALEAELSFEAFCAALDGLVALFVTYAAVAVIDSSLATAGVNVMTLCTDGPKGPVLSADKVDTRKSALASAMAAVGRLEEFVGLRAKIELRLPANPRERLRFVSGKTYLMPLLYHHLRRTAEFKGTGDQLKTRLARYADLDIDKTLSEAIRAASRRF
jgi:hypothetical protein